LLFVGSDTCDLKIKVIPNAAKTAVVGMLGEAVKIRVQAVPEDGRANAALIEFLAKKLKITRKEVALLSGETAREKKVRISGLSREEIFSRLGV